MMRAAFLGWLVALGLGLSSQPLLAHEKHKHNPLTPSVTPGDTQPVAIGGDNLPFTIGGPFSLIDQNGRTVTEADFLGRPFLVFFGYSNCEDFCPVGLQVMLEALDHLGARGAALQPVMITVDPDHDTPEVLAAFAAELDPRLTALTGTAESLASVRKAYHVNTKKLPPSILTEQTVFAHDSYLYLMGSKGEFLTLLPPILSASRMAEIIAAYLGAPQG